MNNNRKRAEELLSRMTLNEKVGQLNQRLYGFRSYVQEGDNFTLTDEFKKEVDKYSGLGCLYGLFRADPWSEKNFDNGLYGERAIRAYNLTQKYVLEHSRLHIPMLMSTESPHGHQALNGYLLPVNLAAGATFDPELMEKAEKVCAKQLKEMGVDLALVSMLDMLRDPRWGRAEECISEDPFLSAQMARGMIRGLHAEDMGVVAKHFCAQGETTGGLNGTAARIGERELYEIHLPTAKAVAEEGAEGVMAAYNEIDGVYCHGNRHLLTDILREELGFKGFIMSDGVALDRLNIVSGGYKESGAMALNAGVDMGLWDQSFSYLEEAVHDGLVSEEVVDEAVLRILELKFERGLFDKPYLNERGERCETFCDGPFMLTDFNEEAFPESREVAEGSAVLLKNNDQLLPVKAEEAGKIAVIGPNANHIYRMIGDYSPEMRAGSYVTILDGIKKAFPASEISFEEGCENVWHTDAPEKREKAAGLAAEADVTVLVLGGSSSRFSGVSFDSNGEAISAGKEIMDCGEGVDCADLKLPGVQMKLFEEVRKQAKKLITIVVAGRPYAIPEIAEKTDALLYAFYPGPFGGSAIANLLTGVKTPSGRLPASLPISAGQLPVYYNQKTSNRVLGYYDLPHKPLYGFGEGMGYSQIQCSDFALREEDGKVFIDYTAANVGDYDDALVMQCYRRMEKGTFVPRVRELIGFKKTFLKKGEVKKLTLTLEDGVNMAYSVHKKYEAVPGTFHLMMMDQGKTLWETELSF